MAEAGIDLHILQRVADHQDPAVTARYLHPDVQAMLDARDGVFGLVVCSWSGAADASASSRAVRMRLNATPTRSDGVDRLVGLARFELATP